jgi:hypothetical protein
VPSNGTVVNIFTHPENDLDGEFYVHGDVSTALVKGAGNYITFPKEAKLSEIKGNCYSVANFPGVIGLIDGTHIRIQAPSDHDDQYVIYVIEMFNR